MPSPSIVQPRLAASAALTLVLTMGGARASELPAYRDAALPVETRVADLLGRMTLEEKVAQLHSAPWEVDLVDAAGRFSPAKAEPVLGRGICHVGRPGYKRSPREAAELTNAIQRFLVEKTRLGVPAFFHEEALHGYMAQGATHFPQAIALGSTWDVDLLRRVYTAAALEVRARGSNYVFTPDLDLARDPRWGRTEETFGEDPYLVARMGEAAVAGLQGEGPGIGPDHVVATAKHFVAHGQPESGSNTGPAPFGERELRRLFLPPFEAAVRAGVHSVMASYNEIDGVPTHINRWLLVDLLRGEWGFSGFVSSDGWGIDQLESIHHVAGSPEEAARLALQAGVDTEAEDGSCLGTLAEQVRAGLVDEARVDEAVGRVLRSKLLLGLFEDPFVDAERAERVTNSPEHQALALQAAREAVVLLKNDGGVLPLDPAQVHSVAVIGPNADGLHLGGYSWDPGRGVTVLEGIRERAGRTITVHHAVGCRFTRGAQDWRGHYEEPVEPADPAEQKPLIDEAVELARRVDVAIVAVGDNEATCREAWSVDHPGDRDSLSLLGRQQELVLRVLDTGTPTVVVLIGGRPLSIPEIAERAPAILEAWYLGQEGGTALAEVLFGDVNPSGKLTVSFPRSVGQVPIHYNHKPSARRGYLFTSATPLFPFGHGLSYTRFEYGPPEVEPARISRGGRATVGVEVTNAGTSPGDEIVQLYVRDRQSSLPRPVQELAGFTRVHLEPGQSRRVELELGPEQLGLWDARMSRVVEPGWFDVSVGGSSADLHSTALEVTQTP